MYETQPILLVRYKDVFLLELESYRLRWVRGFEGAKQLTGSIMGNSTEFSFNPQIIATLVFLIKLYNYCRTHLSNYIQFYMLLKNLGCLAEHAEYLYSVLLI